MHHLGAVLVVVVVATTLLRLKTSGCAACNWVTAEAADAASTCTVLDSTQPSKVAKQAHVQVWWRQQPCPVLP